MQSLQPFFCRVLRKAWAKFLSVASEIQSMKSQIENI